MIENLQLAKQRAKENIWYRAFSVLFHVAMGAGIAYLTIFHFELPLWQSLLYFVGFVIVEQPIMRYIEYLVFVKYYD